MDSTLSLGTMRTRQVTLKFAINPRRSRDDGSQRAPYAGPLAQRYVCRYSTGRCASVCCCAGYWSVVFLLDWRDGRNPQSSSGGGVGVAVAQGWWQMSGAGAGPAPRVQNQAYFPVNDEGKEFFFSSIKRAFRSFKDVFFPNPCWSISWPLTPKAATSFPILKYSATNYTN